MSSLLRRLVSSPSTVGITKARPSGSSSCSTQFFRVRGVHSQTKLPYPIEEGLGDFLSPEALQAVGVDWQNGLLDRVRDEVKGMIKILSCIVHFD